MVVPNTIIANIVAKTLCEIAKEIGFNDKEMNDMARYINADEFIKWLDVGHLRSPSEMCFSEIDVKNMIDKQPAADVVPRSEVDKLEYTLLGVMHSVDKWLDGDELEQDEVNRAITMREKTLRIVETIKTDTAKAIFEEIDKIIEKHHSECYEYEEGAECDTAITYLSYLSVDIDELKKKYLEASK